MWPKRMLRVEQRMRQLDEYSNQRRRLPGVNREDARKTLALQMEASLRRLEYTRIRKERPVDAARADPNSPMFDPELAAIHHLRNGRLDEAFWITFLATHFGKHARYGWKRLVDVYSGLGQKTWTWDAVSADPTQFRRWLARNGRRIGGAFSNHRKYETLKDGSARGTAAVVESYIQWVGPEHSHTQLIARIVGGRNDPEANFDSFYQDMTVTSFGRLGKFDFLALVGRLDLAPISPGSAYLQGATGPLRGARLLFGGRVDAGLNTHQLQAMLTELDAVLQIGMQAMEDSLCNWQKSPRQFVHFRG